MNENQSIGMMEGAFFVPKSDLLAWVNSTLQLEVKQIEQLGTGAIYCQLIDAMYPGKIAMARVNWRARNEWEFISNFKVLQQGFGKCKIQKYIDIEKLSKGKYQDNLEFVQWLKRYFDLHNKNDLSNYDATTARKNAQVDLSFVDIRNPLKAYLVFDPADRRIRTSPTRT
jgi:RP/EB family microtubule-associated protein